MNRIHRLFTLCLFVGIFSTLYALPKRITVSGRVVSETADSVAEPLEMANVALLTKGDSAYINGVSADATGAFSLVFNPLKGKNYMLKVSYTGMRVKFEDVSVDKDKFDAGTIALSPDKMLGEVVVEEKMKMMELVGDTTVFNADAFALKKDAMLEDLVKRIPGLEYDKSTKKFTYNGKTINELLVNGESFYNKDYKTALETLTARIIKQLKVYDKRSDTEEATGIRSGDENYVVDIHMKPEFSGQMFINGRLSAGNQNRKEAEVMGNMFKMRKGREGYSLRASTGNTHLMTDYKGARNDNLSMNVQKKISEVVDMNAALMYGYSRTGSESTSYNERYLTQGNTYSYNEGDNNSRGNNINANFGLRFGKRRGKTSGSLSGNFTSSEQRGANRSRSAMFNGYVGLDAANPFDPDAYNAVADSLRVNSSDNNSLSKSRNTNYNMRGSFIKKFDGDYSPTITFTGNMRNSSSKGETVSISTTNYYRIKNHLGEDSVLYRNQYNLSPTDNQSYSGGFDITQPFSDNFRIQAGYNISYSTNENNRNTYDLSKFGANADGNARFDIPAEYESGFVDSLSNRSSSRTVSHEISLRMNLSTSWLEMNAGMTVSPERRTLDRKVGKMHGDTIRRAVNFSPELSFSFLKPRKDEEEQMRRKRREVDFENAPIEVRHGAMMGNERVVVVSSNGRSVRMNRGRGTQILNIRYSGRSSQPSISDLLSITDNSNPLYITRGNPNLKSSFDHNVSANFNLEKPNLSLSANWSTTTNMVDREVIYNSETGGQISQPVNINGNWRWNANAYNFVTVNNVLLNFDASYSYSRSVSLVNENMSPQSSRSRSHTTGITTGVRMTYFREWLNLAVSGNWSYNNSINFLRMTSDYNRSYRAGTEISFELPGNVNIGNNVWVNFRNGTYIKDNSLNEVRWDLNVSWRFLKARAAEIKFSWNDILNQVKNYTFSSSSSGYNESYQHRIGNYFMFSFSYRFVHAIKRK